jgi:hypothetical protein
MGIEEEEAKYLWDQWRRQGIVPAMSFLELVNLIRRIRDALSMKGYDPGAVEYLDRIDPEITYEENLTQLEANLNISLREKALPLPPEEVPVEVPPEIIEEKKRRERKVWPWMRPPRFGAGQRVKHNIFGLGRVEEVKWLPKEKKWAVKVRFDSGEERTMKEDDPDLHPVGEYSTPTPPRFESGSLVRVDGQTGTVERMEWTGKGWEYVVKVRVDEMISVLLRVPEEKLVPTKEVKAEYTVQPSVPPELAKLAEEIRRRGLKLLREFAVRYPERVREPVPPEQMTPEERRAWEEFGVTPYRERTVERVEVTEIPKGMIVLTDGVFYYLVEDTKIRQISTDRLIARLRRAVAPVTRPAPAPPAPGIRLTEEERRGLPWAPASWEEYVAELKRRGWTDEGIEYLRRRWRYGF